MFSTKIHLASLYPLTSPTRIHLFVFCSCPPCICSLAMPLLISAHECMFTAIHDLPSVISVTLVCIWRMLALCKQIISAYYLFVCVFSAPILLLLPICIWLNAHDPKKVCNECSAFDLSATYCLLGHSILAYPGAQGFIYTALSWPTVLSCFIYMTHF